MFGEGDEYGIWHEVDSEIRGPALGQRVEPRPIGAVSQCLAKMSGKRWVHALLLNVRWAEWRLARYGQENLFFVFCFAFLCWKGTDKEGDDMEGIQLRYEGLESDRGLVA